MTCPTGFSRSYIPRFCFFLFFNLYRAIVVIRTATFSWLIGLTRILGDFLPCICLVRRDRLFLVKLILSAAKAHDATRRFSLRAQIPCGWLTETAVAKRDAIYRRIGHLTLPPCLPFSISHSHPTCTPPR